MCILERCVPNLKASQATSKDGKEGGVELIQPPPGSKPGERVYFEGPEYESMLIMPFKLVYALKLLSDAQPVSQLNPKKKIFETVQPGMDHDDIFYLDTLFTSVSASPGFTTLDTREAAWINPETKSVHRIRTKDGVCVAPTFVGASLS